MNQTKLTSGIFVVFRMFVAIRLFLYLVGLSFQLLIPSPRSQIILTSSLIGLGETILLLGYLSMPWLLEKLGRTYLPLAIGFSSLGPMVENILIESDIAAYLKHNLPSGILLSDETVRQFYMNEQFQLMILLFMLVILVSWMYRFRWVVFYCLGMAAASLVLLMFIPIDQKYIFFQAALIVPRTVLYLLFGFVITRLSVEQRDQNARLARTNLQLSQYARTLEQLTISRERNRLAREFHDTLAHTLSATAVQLEAVSALWDQDPEKARNILGQSLAGTRAGLGESRRAIQSLRASPLEDLGFELALKSMANGFADRCGFSMTLQFPDNLPTLNPEVEHSLYRIIEEALRNTAQHSQASQVEIRLGYQNGRLSLTLQDNGRGFDLNSLDLEGHFGLRGMQERAESIGAQIKMESQNNLGTRIVVLLEGV